MQSERELRRDGEEDESLRVVMSDKFVVISDKFGIRASFVVINDSFVVISDEFVAMSGTFFQNARLKSSARWPPVAGRMPPTNMSK